ncbi:MAG: HAMP domain-containing histidine kinase [Muribaculaceae bacterium]|nr:HAMP domain-containing histidine kinase [Muribaculaceae bacterium]
MNIYDVRRYGTIILLAVAVILSVCFLLYSDRLTRDLAAQERERMSIWADATRQIATAGPDTDIEFLLSIIERNHTIPVLLVDADGNIVLHRNFDLPDPVASPLSLTADSLSPSNAAFLSRALSRLRESREPLVVTTDPSLPPQLIYYDDSRLLRRLTRFPYVQLGVMLLFLIVVYLALNATKRAEQNKVWVGLSKETAHQLGTPISSLMGWMEVLRADPAVDPAIVDEMERDTTRLSSIASRFSKIGSRPAMESTSVPDLILSTAAYMRTRVSSRVTIDVDIPSSPLISNPLPASPPLLGWVMENLIKNAVDAMEGQGKITIALSHTPSSLIIDVTDTGHGIPRKHLRTIFRPGFTTKSRGWGLGLTLARRIITDYHHGTIEVLRSTPAGTTFRITLPLSNS